MANLFKPIGKVFFFTLLMAVALRPVMVYTCGSSAQPNNLPVQSLAVVSGHSLAVIPVEISKQAVVSSVFKVIPKESVSVTVLTPQFSKERLCLNSDRDSAIHSIYSGFSTPQVLNLRI